VTAQSDAPEDDEAQLESRRADRRVRTIVVGALGLAVTLWDVAFDFGAYRAVFFSQIHWLWVLTTTTAICLIFLGRDQRHVGPRGITLMAIPSLMLLFQFVRAQNLVGEGPLRTAVFLLFLGAYVLALPYTLFVIANIIDRDLIDVTSRRVLSTLVAVAIVITATGFFVGQYNRAFLVCDDFKVSGNDLPDNCRDEDSPLIFR
jgi:hypothetical protein